MAYRLVSVSMVFILFGLIQFYGYRIVVWYSLKTAVIPPQVLLASPSGHDDSLDNVLLAALSRFPLGGARPSFMPAQAQTKTTLWVDRCEVTQAQFARFKDWAGRYPNRVYQHAKMPSNWRFYSSVADHRIAGQLSRPVGGVTFFDAFAYCRSGGGRLLTAFEYQWLAGGQKGQLYPWGNTFNDRLWPYENPWLNAYQACDAQTTDRAAEEILHLGSHVAEWVWDNTRHLPIIQGYQGEQSPKEVFALTAVESVGHFSERNNFTGFRCAYEQPPAPASPWLTRISSVKTKAGSGVVGVNSAKPIPALLATMPIERYGSINALLNSPSFEPMNKAMVSEVSVQQFATFLRDPFVKLRFYANKHEPQGLDYYPSNWAMQQASPDLPVRGVNWWSAYAFARWLGGRLPTEHEWLHLYSNGGATNFPWGDDDQPGDTVHTNSFIKPFQVYRDSSDENTWGIAHLSGNVSEWTATRRLDIDGSRIIVKGGNFMLPQEETRYADFSLALLPGQSSRHTGFRVIFE